MGRGVGRRAAGPGLARRRCQLVPWRTRTSSQRSRRSLALRHQTAPVTGLFGSHGGSEGAPQTRTTSRAGRYRAPICRDDAPTGNRTGRCVGDGPEMVKQAGVAAWLIGIAAVIAITTWSGLDAVGHAVASVGWGILLVVVVRTVTVAVAGVGWWLIFPAQTRPGLRLCLLLRFVRKAT